MQPLLDVKSKASRDELKTIVENYLNGDGNGAPTIKNAQLTSASAANAATLATTFALEEEISNPMHQGFLTARTSQLQPQLDFAPSLSSPLPSSVAKSSSPAAAGISAAAAAASSQTTPNFASDSLNSKFADSFLSSYNSQEPSPQPQPVKPVPSIPENGVARFVEISIGRGSWVLRASDQSELIEVNFTGVFSTFTYHEDRSYDTVLELQRLWVKDSRSASQATASAPLIEGGTPSLDEDISVTNVAIDDAGRTDELPTTTTTTAAQQPLQHHLQLLQKSWILYPEIQSPEPCMNCGAIYRIGKHKSVEPHTLTKQLDQILTISFYRK